MARDVLKEVNDAERKKIRSEVEELADYLRVNIADDSIYEAVVLFGRKRLIEGMISEPKVYENRDV